MQDKMTIVPKPQTPNPKPRPSPRAWRGYATQRKILAYITDYSATHGYGPTYREIATALGHKSLSGVMGHVKKLLIQGELVAHAHIARGLSLPKVSAATLPCRQCQQENPAEFHFCARCGYPTKLGDEILS